MLGAGELELLDAAKIDPAALLKMFPTLRLDAVLLDRTLPAPGVSNDSLAGLVSLFDSDSDAFIDQDEFLELFKFCNAWRQTFYVDTAPSAGDALRFSGRLNGAGTSGFNRLTNSARGAGPNAAANAQAINRSSSSSRAQGGNNASTKSGAAAAGNAAVDAKPQPRRGSGFGPRLGLAPPGGTEGGRSKSPQLQRPKNIPPGSVRPNSRDAARPASRSASPAAEDEERPRRPSKTRLDGTRGGFYSASTKVDMENHTDEDFLEFVENMDKRRGSFTVEEMYGHPLGSSPAPPSFRGNRKPVLSD